MNDSSSTESGSETSETAETEPHVIEAAIPENARFSMPASANHREAAAIAAAVGAHLRDCAVAAAEATDDTPTECDPWKLCGRLGCREPPRTTVRGEEWKAAGRTRR